MHFIDFIILGIVLVLAFFAVRYCIRHKNSCGGCAGCAKKNCCRRKEDQEDSKQ